VLGEGSFSVVHRATFHPTGEDVAVKIIKSGYDPDKMFRLAM
jgi:serine/threonine protein kinase